MKQFMTVGIVIVTYNSSAYIESCLNSIMAQTYQNFRIFLWDNCSTDGTVSCIKNFNKVDTYFAAKNIGFAEACNRSAKKLTEEGCDSILFINPDTTASKDMLSKLISGMENTHSDIVQPSILLFDQKRINTTGNSIHYLGFSFCEYYRKEYSPGHNKQITVASGACMLIKKEIIETIGCFDPMFFTYHEDTDFSWRASLSGYKISHITEAIVYHDYNYRIKGKKYFFLERNRLYMLLKNYSARSILLILPPFIFIEMQMWFYSLITGWMHWKCLSYLSFLKNFKTLTEKRKEIQKNRKVPDCLLFKTFQAELKLEGINNPIILYFANPLLKLYYCQIKKVL